MMAELVDNMQPARPLKCDWQACFKDFDRKSDLKRHYRTHTNERPFLCLIPACGKSFTQKHALTVHIRTHTGEKPHPCEHCGKKFSDISSLIRHRKIHMGLRQHKCTACEKSFLEKAGLTTHFKSRSHKKLIRNRLPVSLDFDSKYDGLDQVNVTIHSASRPSQLLCHSAATLSSGGSGRICDVHETSDPRLVTEHHSCPRTDQISSLHQSLDFGLGADETSDIQGDHHEPSDQEIRTNVPYVDAAEKTREHNSAFSEAQFRHQNMTLSLKVGSYDRWKLRSITDAYHHSLQEDASMISQDTYEVVSEREEFVNPVASNTPSLRPPALTSLRISEEITQTPQAKQRWSGATTTSTSRQAPGDKLRSLLARQTQSPCPYSAGSSLQAESAEVCRTQVVVDYDSSNLDAYLMAQAKPKSRRQPTVHELADTQIWAYVDPCSFWAPERPASWYQEKATEIAARGGRKANFGQVITKQNRKERAEKGWNIHQSRESNFGTAEDLERIRMVEDMIGIPDIKDMVPTVIDGLLCVVDAPQTDEHTLTEPGRKGRPARCFPL